MTAVVPEGRAIETLAEPPANVAVPRVLMPATNVTVPVGVEPVDDVTVAVNLTFCPAFDGLTEDRIAVVVDAGFTICPSAGEVLVAFCESPP